MGQGSFAPAAAYGIQVLTIEEASSSLGSSFSPTECAPGEDRAPALDSTIADKASFDSEVLRGMEDLVGRLGRFWGPVGSSEEEDSEGGGGPCTFPGAGSDSFERYQVIGRVGEGGFGLVFRARDLVLNRDVALKIPRPEALMSPPLRRRFLREARAAAALDHPNIVQVHDAGQVGPLCYIASAFCEGLTLAAWLDRPFADPTSGQAARLIRALALALQHAHDEGILHRDLKPSNILLQGDPNEPDLDGFVPRISDFGLAKFADEVGGETRSDTPMGSPPYMAPEQALGRMQDIGPGSDIYGLGAILYQLLTGFPPFRGKSRGELLRQIVDADPRSPRSLRPSLERDIETICLKCLAKEPWRRYPTAQTLADDLGRFLRREPVLARPAPAWEVAAKWCRNQPWKAATLLLIIASVLGAAGAAFWRNGILRRHNGELEGALSLARTHEASTRRLLYDSKIRLAQHALDSGNPELTQEILEGLAPGHDQDDLREFAWHYLHRKSRLVVSLMFDPDTVISRLALSPDGRTLFAGGPEGWLSFWNLAEERQETKVLAHSGKVDGLVFSPDGKVLASWTRVATAPEKVKLWNPATGRELATVAESADGIVNGVLFSGDGGTLVVRSIHEPHGRSIYTYTFWDFSKGPGRIVPLGEPTEWNHLEFSPDGRWLATVEPDRPAAVTLRDPSTRRPIRTIANNFGGIIDIEFTPNGKRLLASSDRGLTVWEAESGWEVASFEGLSASKLQFSPDGDRAATISVDTNSFSLIVDLLTRPRLCISRTKLANRIGAIDAAFSPDGRLLAVGGRAIPPALWDTSSGREVATFPNKSVDAPQTLFTRDGQSLIFASEDGRVRCWHFGPTRTVPAELPKIDKELWAIAYSPDGTTVASAGDDNLIRLWDPQDCRLKSTLKGHAYLVASVSFSPDGTRLVSGSFDSTVRIWDLQNHQPPVVINGHVGTVRAVAFSPDGRKVASAGSDRILRLWDAETGKPLSSMNGHRDTIHALTFGVGGKILVTASDDRTIKVWDAETGAEKASLVNFKKNFGVAFSCDGSQLVSSDDTGTVTLWDTATWTKQKVLKGSDAGVRGISLSPDRKLLATACTDSKVRIWDMISGQMTLELAGHQKQVNAISFAPGGKTIASCDDAGAIKLWQAGDN